MYTFAIILHLTACILMIASILLQAGKGAEIGASFGGSSQTVFGSRGPGTFLSKVTIGAAVVFMLTSLSLAMLSRQANTASTVIDLHPPTQHESTSSTPAPTDSTPETTPTESAAETVDTTTPETPPATSEKTKPAAPAAPEASPAPSSP